ncbi:hypothetical protein FQN55_007381 [Onygenales sp. PD_40]|nr:hypothetical protein FQN55_007381 [Onygenales sp. PD_40]
MRLSLLISALAATAATTCSAAHIGQRRGHDHARLHKTAAVKSRATLSSTEHRGLNNDAVYKPINVVTSRETGVIESRDTTLFSNLHPADNAHMVFGKVGVDQTVKLANMVLYADPKLPIVMMEAFEGLTSAVDCNGNDGQLSLTFSSAEAFNYALESWSYINEDTEKQFLVITNHDGCGPEGERQSYKITDVDNDKTNNIVFLNASPVPWNEVASSFDMEFGKVTVPSSKLRSIRARGLIDWLDEQVEKAKDGFDNVIDKIKGIGDGDLSESVTIPFSVGEQGARKELFEDFTKRPPRLTLACTDCFANANFETTGTVKVENFKPSSLLLEVSPQDFQATVQLEATIAQTNPTIDILNWDQTIIEAAIPGAGIVIPNIFTLGAKAAFNIQGNAGVIGTTTFTFGAKSTLPNGSKMSIDLVNPDNSATDGFETASVEPIFDVDKASITANIAAGPQLALTLGVEILDNTGIEAGVTFGVPTVNLNVTAGFDENGFCSATDPITSGIKVTSAANFDVVLAVKGSLNENSQSIFNRKLVNIPLATFLDKCFPVEGITPPKQTPSSTVVTSTAGGVETKTVVPVPLPSGTVGARVVEKYMF